MRVNAIYQYTQAAKSHSDSGLKCRSCNEFGAMTANPFLVTNGIIGNAGTIVGPAPFELD